VNRHPDEWKGSIETVLIGGGGVDLAVNALTK